MMSATIAEAAGVLTILGLILLMTLSSCAGSPSTAGLDARTGDGSANETFEITLQAEDAELVGTRVALTHLGFEGRGYVTDFDQDDDRAVFTVSVPSAGTYAMTVRSLVSIGWGSKVNDIYVQGRKALEFETPDTGRWETPFPGTVNLVEGENEIAIRKNWGWFELDSITISSTTPDTSGFRDDIPDHPVDPDATAEAVDLYRYLLSIYGNATISGQMDLTWDDRVDMKERVYADTGRYPALMGYDFMNYGSQSGSGLHQVEEAIDHWDDGGIVAFCWHWRDPRGIVSGSEVPFYTDRTDFRIPMDGARLDTTSPDFTLIQADVDRIAGELRRLQDAGVAVIWRPLHEASGGWFWWGASRNDGIDPAVAQIALWRYLYDRLVNYHGLHNLIWTWNGQAESWYPGDDYVDIVGEDVYPGRNVYSSQFGRYYQALHYPSGSDRMVAMTENGSIPDPDQVAADGAWWLYFMVWNDGNGPEGVTDSSNFWTGEYHNDNEHKVHVYNHERVITLDELPPRE
jgi:mannan endo-1,4-beta-mannosidase